MNAESRKEKFDRQNSSAYAGRPWMEDGGSDGIVI